MAIPKQSYIRTILVTSRIGDDGKIYHQQTPNVPSDSVLVTLNNQTLHARLTAFPDLAFTREITQKICLYHSGVIYFNGVRRHDGNMHFSHDELFENVIYDDLSQAYEALGLTNDLSPLPPPDQLVTSE